MTRGDHRSSPSNLFLSFFLSQSSASRSHESILEGSGFSQNRLTQRRASSSFPSRRHRRASSESVSTGSSRSRRFPFTRGRGHVAPASSSRATVTTVRQTSHQVLSGLFLVSPKRESLSFFHRSCSAPQRDEGIPSGRDTRSRSIQLPPSTVR